MDIFSNAVPYWLSALLLLCFIVPVLMIANLVRQGIDRGGLEASEKLQKLPRTVVLFFSFYYLYVGIMSFTGIFQVNSLPPRVLLFTALPLLLFYFLFVFRTKVFWKILENVQLSGLVRLHFFRFVGVFFLIGWLYGILPRSFALIAGMGDIFVAVTAIFVAKLIDHKAEHFKKITLIWNIIGFWDIVSVIVSAIWVTHQAMENHSQGILEMTKFPFCLIPAFAPATIIFLHIAIFKKLKME